MPATATIGAQMRAIGTALNSLNKQFTRLHTNFKSQSGRGGAALTGATKGNKRTKRMKRRRLGATSSQSYNTAI